MRRAPERPAVRPAPGRSPPRQAEVLTEKTVFPWRHKKCLRSKSVPINKWKDALQDSRRQAAEAAERERQEERARQEQLKVLGVSRDASPAEIKKAYHAAAQEWHANKSTDPRAKEHFMKITKAYEQLTGQTAASLREEEEAERERERERDQALQPWLLSEDDKLQQALNDTAGLLLVPQEQLTCYQRTLHVRNLEQVRADLLYKPEPRGHQAHPVEWPERRPSHMTEGCYCTNIDRSLGRLDQAVRSSTPREQLPASSRRRLDFGLGGPGRTQPEHEPIPRAQPAATPRPARAQPEHEPTSRTQLAPTPPAAEREPLTAGGTGATPPQRRSCSCEPELSYFPTCEPEPWLSRDDRRPPPRPLMPPFWDFSGDFPGDTASTGVGSDLGRTWSPRNALHAWSTPHTWSSAGSPIGSPGSQAPYYY